MYRRSRAFTAGGELHPALKTYFDRPTLKNGIPQSRSVIDSNYTQRSRRPGSAISVGQAIALVFI
jgi:hypothetical protein